MIVFFDYVACALCFQLVADTGSCRVKARLYWALLAC